jgi:hypothetical protein
MNQNFLKTALILSLSCFLIACGGSSGKSSEPSAPDKIDLDKPDKIDLDKPDKTTQPTPLELALAQGKASLVADGDVFRTGALALIQQKNQTYHSDIQQLLNLNSDNSAKADGSSLTSIDWDNSHDAAQLSAQFGFNTPL